MFKCYNNTCGDIMNIFLIKKINSLYVGAEISFKLYMQPYLYEISSDFGNEVKEIDAGIKKFIKVIEKNFDKKDLSYFYLNIDDLRVEKANELDSKNINACYDIIDNTINIKRRTKYTIFHELFHLSARDGFDTGFERSIGNKVHNRGLNEGYTDLLTHRYFGDLENDKAGYQIEMTMARMIEDIIGKDIMEESYLRCHGKTIESYLLEYMGIKAYTMLNLLDDIERITKKDEYSEERIQKKIIQIYIYILEGYIKKQYLLYKNNEIDISTVLKNIDDFTKRYGKFIEYDDVDYSIYTDKILTKVLHNNLIGIEKKIS